MEFYIEEVKNFSLGLTIVLNKLLQQLDTKAVPLVEGEIKDMISSQANHLFVARMKSNKEIVGMLTLIIYRIPVWKKAWFEDLVVDKNYRNKGIGTKLIQHAIENAKANEVKSVNFTSRPEREDANRLYERLGFKKRNTNIYWIKL